MRDDALDTTPTLKPRRNWLVGADSLGDVVDVGSIVRVFAVDALREITLILAPAGVSGTTPGMVPENSPLAIALMGGRVGETRRWDSPTGPRRLQIVRIVGRLSESAWTRSTSRLHTPSPNTDSSREAGPRQPSTEQLPEAA